RTLFIQQGVPHQAVPTSEHGLAPSVIETFAWQAGSYTVEATAPTESVGGTPVAPFEIIWEGITTHYPEEALRDWLGDDYASYVVATAFFAPRFGHLTAGVLQS